MIPAKVIRQAIYNALNKPPLSVHGGLLPDGSAGIVHATGPGGDTVPGAGTSSATMGTVDFPILVYNEQSGVTRSPFGARAGIAANPRDHSFKSMLWLVKGVDRAGSSSRVEDIAAAVYDFLHHRDIPIPRWKFTNGIPAIDGAGDKSGQTMQLAHESDVTYTETTDGVQYRHHGGYYRIVVQDTN